MNYTISTGNGKLTVKVSGKIDKGAVISSRTFVQSLIEKGYLNFILDMDGLEDEREMIYHVSLVNTFKNTVERSGGKFALVSTRDSLKYYLSITGLQRLFSFGESTGYTA